MDNTKVLSMIETMRMGKINWCKRFSGYKNMENTVKDKILSDWIKSDLFDLESELKYLNKLSKMLKIGIDDYLLSTMISIDVITNNPIGMRSIYNYMIDKDRFNRYIQLNEEDSKEIEKGVEKHWTKIRNKEKDINIMGGGEIATILNNLNQRFGIVYEVVLFLGIDLTKDKMYMCLASDDDTYTIFEVENNSLKFRQHFDKKDLSKYSDDVDFNLDLVRKVFKVRDLDMLFI